MTDLWNPPMMCPECKTKLQSTYSGEFVMCKCPAQCFVDQTATKVGKVYFSRGGGHSFPVPWKNDQDDGKGDKKDLVGADGDRG